MLGSLDAVIVGKAVGFDDGAADGEWLGMALG